MRQIDFKRRQARLRERKKLAESMYRSGISIDEIADAFHVHPDILKKTYLKTILKKEERKANDLRLIEDGKDISMSQPENRIEMKHLDTMNELQKKVCYFLVGVACEWPNTDEKDTDIDCLIETCKMAENDGALITVKDVLDTMTKEQKDLVIGLMKFAMGDKKLT